MQLLQPQHSACKPSWQQAQAAAGAPGQRQTRVSKAAAHRQTSARSALTRVRPWGSCMGTWCTWHSVRGVWGWSCRGRTPRAPCAGSRLSGQCGWQRGRGGLKFTSQGTASRGQCSSCREGTRQGLKNAHRGVVLSDEHKGFAETSVSACALLHCGERAMTLVDLPAQELGI